MKIDKNGHVPLYRQVEKVLEEKIISRQWDVGYQLPTEQELSDHFDVSTITVKRAVIELANKGYLYRQRGKGTFVSGAKKEKNLNLIFSLSTEGKEEHPHELISFTIEDAGAEIAQKLKVQEDSMTIKIKRLKIEEGEPAALEYTYLPYVQCQDLTANDINNELVYNILRDKFHISLGKAKLVIKPFVAMDEQADLLQVEPGTPVFEWERFTYTKEEKTIEYSKFYVRPDKESYYTEVNF